LADYFSMRFSSFPSLALFTFLLFFLGQLCVYIDITQLAFVSVGFSHGPHWHYKL